MVARKSDTRKRREFFADNSIKVLGPFSIEPAEARIRFHKQCLLRVQSRFDRSRFAGASKEERGGCDQRQGEGYLHYDQRIARQESPTRTVHVFAGLLFQISDHGRARELERWSERKAKCAQNTEYQGRAEDHRAWAAQPNNVDRQNGAE